MFEITANNYRFTFVQLRHSSLISVKLLLYLWAYFPANEINPQNLSIILGALITTK